MSTASPTLPTAEQLIKLMAAMQRGRWRMAIFLLPPGLILLGLSLALGALQGHDGWIAIGVVGGLVALMGLVGVVGALKTAPGVRAVASALTDHPEQLAWVYGFEHKVNGVTARTSVIFRTLADQQVDFDTKALLPYTMGDIFSYARTVNPKVLIGYHEENEKRFRALPR